MNQAVARTAPISIILTTPQSRLVDNLTGLSGIVWSGSAVVTGSVAKFGFSRKIEFLVAIDSMTYRIPHSSKTNFATEP